MIRGEVFALLLAVTSGLRIIREQEIDDDSLASEEELLQDDTWMEESRSSQVPLATLANERSLSVAANGHYDETRTTGKFKFQRKTIFGTHHKAGSVLLRNVGAELAKATGGVGKQCSGCYMQQCDYRWNNVPILMRCNFKALDLEKVNRTTNGDFRAVHIIRDPMAMLVSDYIYHRTEQDLSPKSPGWFRNAPLEKGLLLEAQFLIRRIFPMMVSSYKEGNNYPGKVLTITFEDFGRSSEDFDRVVDGIFQFTAGDQENSPQILNLVKEKAKIEDIHRNPTHSDGWSGGKHVGKDKELKQKVKDALKSLPQDVLDKMQEFRKDLDYDVDAAEFGVRTQGTHHDGYVFVSKA